MLFKIELYGKKEVNIVILFITGATHTGKTKLAQKLMEKYKIPYFINPFEKD